MKMRITFIITQKFVTFVEKVMETCNYRNINDAFDAIIDQANEKQEDEGEH